MQTISVAIKNYTAHEAPAAGVIVNAWPEPIDSAAPISGVTDAGGVAAIEVPPGSYLVQVIVPPGQAIRANQYWLPTGYAAEPVAVGAQPVTLVHAELTGVAKAPVPTPVGPPELGITTADMTFSDLFPAGSPDPKKWATRLPFNDPGARSGGGVAVYLDTGVTLSDGSVINPFDQSELGLLSMRAGFLAGLTAPDYPSKTYYGACICSYGFFAQDFGFFTARVQLPGKAGGWGGLIAYCFNDIADHSKYTTKEMDFDEGFGANPRYVDVTTHDNPGDAGFKNVGAYLLTPVNLSEGLHDVWWNFAPEGISIWVDGVSVTPKPLPIPADFATAWYFAWAQDVDRTPPAKPYWPNNAPEPINYPQYIQLASFQAFRTASTTRVFGPAALMEVG